MLSRISTWISRLPDAVRRAIRTAMQAFAGAAVWYLVGAVAEAGTLIGLTGATWLTIIDRALVAGVAGAAAAFGQNELEDRGVIRARLKLPTPDPDADLET